MQIDKDRGGTVDYQEFEAWWDKQEDDAKDTLITKADERATALAQEPDRFWRDTPANAPFRTCRRIGPSPQVSGKQPGLLPH